MRTVSERIKHAIIFEIIGLIFITFILSQLGFDVAHSGVMGLAFSLIATGWNYIYNIWFDKQMLKRTGSPEKKQKHRVLHALLFELGLLWLTIPVMSWWLKITLWEAFVMDIGLVIFYLFYAYIFNFIYDKLFPVKQAQ